MIDFIKTNLESIFICITSVISLASAISALTPNTADDKIVATIKKIVDTLALNVGNAKTSANSVA